MSKTKKGNSRQHFSSESDTSEYSNKNTSFSKGKLKKNSKNIMPNQVDTHKKRYQKHTSSDSQSSDSEKEQINVKMRKEKETGNKPEPKSKWDSPREQSAGYRYHKKYGRKENAGEIYRQRSEDSRHYKTQIKQHTDGNRKANSKEHDRHSENRTSLPERNTHRHQEPDRRDDYVRNSRRQNDNNSRTHNYRHSNDSKGKKRYSSPDRNRAHHAERKRRNRNNSGSPHRKDNESNQDDYVWGKKEQQQDKDKQTAEKDKPNFGLSGKLTEDVNTFNGVVIKYSEPPEARKPRRRWRLYPFKGENVMATLYIHRQSCYLIGRDRKVVDLPVDHPSCSKQHAALQYRLVTFERDNGTIGKRIRPYLIDLESSNGTFVNNNKIEPKKYVELLERDVIKFGFSSREYVLLHENSKDDDQDDDVGSGDEDVKNIVIKKEPN